MNFILGFGADKPLQPIGQAAEFKFEFQVRAPAGHLDFAPEGYSRKQSKALTAKSTAKLLVRAPAQLGRSDGPAQTQGVS